MPCVFDKFSRSRLDKVQYTELNQHRFQFAREYIQALDRKNPLPGDKLRVFDGIVRLAKAEVFLADLLSGGLRALQAWWSDVERRPVVDLAACSILQSRLKWLEQIERDLASRSNRAPLVDKIAHVRMELAHRGAKLAS